MFLFTLQRKELRHRSVDALCNLTNHVKIKVHRDAIFETVLSLYKDVTFCTSTFPSFEFQGEDGEDLDGLTREIFSEFWEKAFIVFFEGTAEFTPRTSPDVTEETMMLLGRVASHGYVLCKVFPVRLCKAFVVASICGAHTVTDDELLSSFLAYHTGYEREVLQKGLDRSNDDNFSADLREALIDVLEPYNLRKVPTPTSLKQQLIAIARCEFINKVSWAISGFNKGLAHCHDIWKSTTKEEIEVMYSELVPSQSSVLALLKVEDESQMTSGKKEVLNYFKRFVRIADDVTLRKLLRYITGSEVMTIDKITVIFHSNTGGVPEIISHTCSAVLDLPSSGYVSFNDFRDQVTNILNNPLSWRFSIV